MPSGIDTSATSPVMINPSLSNPNGLHLLSLMPDKFPIALTNQLLP